MIELHSLCSDLINLVEQCPVTSDTDWIAKRNDLIVRSRTVLRSPLSNAGQNRPTLSEIGQRLRTQDNRCTADPIFQVRGLRRIYGMDPDYCDDPVWVDTEDGCIEVDPPDDEDNPGDFLIETGYIDIWEVLMVSFTEEGCKEHLKLNGHNYRLYRKVEVYADTLRRCPEMLTIREALLSLPNSPPLTPTNE